MEILKKIKQFIKPKKYFTNTMKKYKKYDIGDFTFGKPRIFSPVDKIKIGKYCSFASGVTIYTSTDHNMNNISVYPFFLINKKQKYQIYSKGGVIIENDVWIGDGVVILDGVTVENGAIIGSRSVVTKDVKSYEVVAGNPAKHIKFRFEREIIDKLLQLSWWNWTNEKVKQNMDILSSNNLEKITSLINTD